jgi:bacterioferritin (cytochrome b1)
MSDHLKREMFLRLLLRDNFVLARQSRHIRNLISDPSLIKYFQGLSSRHNQFASELADAISFYGGEPIPFSSSSTSQNLSAGSLKKLLKKSYKAHKRALEDYRNALSQINDGSCREIFIRHKARLENMIFELKALKTLMSFRKGQKQHQGQEI